MNTTPRSYQRRLATWWQPYVRIEGRDEDMDTIDDTNPMNDVGDDTHIYAHEDAIDVD